MQLLVGGALTAGFRLTNNRLGNTPMELGEVQARATKAKSKGGVIDIEAKVLIPPYKPILGTLACLSRSIASLLKE